MARCTDPNIPIFEGGELAGLFSPPHKYPTGRPLTYNGAPAAGRLLV